MLFGASLLLLAMLLAFGIPIAFALAIVASGGLTLLGGSSLVLGILETAPLGAIDSFEFVTIPMFILMAHFLLVSRISGGLFEAAAVWLDRVPGGLAVATAVTGAAFGAISGSSTAAAATLSSTSIPVMVQQGYERRFASGVVAISGTLAMLIPPSVAIVFLGLLSGLSVGDLLIAGILPGLLVTLVIALTVLWLVWRDPSRAPSRRPRRPGERLRSLRVLLPFALLFGLVTGSIYLGIATPVEASALGALGAFGFALHSGHLTWASFSTALVATARTTAMIALVVIAAQIYGYFITLTQTTQGLLQAIGASELPHWVILAVILLVYIALGCILDQLSILILTIPVVLPVIVTLGYDPIWFGILVIVTAELGMVTPPLGLNVFVVSKYTGIPVGEVFRGVWPHVVAHILLIVLLCIFPELILWLPGTMAG